MALVLARDELTDADLVDRIGRGDPRAAARFWVRHWPTALTAARGLVEPAEVPGLAAEALIGTLAAVRVGTGPRENAAVFVIDAVHELGGELTMQHLSGTAYPDVFASPTLRAAFADLPVEDQQLLWAALADGLPDADLAATLGTSVAEVAAEREDVLTGLQETYLRRHAESAQLSDCVETHGRFTEVVADDGSSLPRETWVHVSDCATCTEAFHELAHSSVDLGPLLGAGAYPGPLPAAPVAMPPVVAAPVLAEPIEPVLEPDPDNQPVALFEPAPEPVAVAKAAIEPELDAPPEEGRRRRPFALVLGAAALAAVVALAVNALGSSDTTTPSAASTGSSGSPYVAPTLPSYGESGAPTPSGAPTVTTAATTTSGSPTPTTAPTDEAEAEEPTRAPTPTRATEPTRSPTPAGPGPTAQPSDPGPDPEPPPATEEPSPTPTPTPPCNLVQKLLGLC